MTVYTAFWASRSGFALLCRVLRGAGELAAARGEINGTMPRPTPGEIGLAVLLVVGIGYFIGPDAWVYTFRLHCSFCMY